MPVLAICTAADAVGYEISLSCGESRRDMVFYAEVSEVAHGKKKPASQKTPAFMFCTAADAVGYEIVLSCGESRRDIVFYAAAKGCPHENLFCSKNCDTRQCLSFEEFKGSTTTS